MGLPTSPQRSPTLPVKKIPVHIKVIEFILFN